MTTEERSEEATIASLAARIEELERENATLLQEVEALEEPTTDRLRSTSRESELRLKLLYENARDYIYTLSSDGMLISLNDAFETITGWRPHQWIGKRYDGLVHPEDREQAERNLQLALREETPPPNELRLVKKSGEYVWVEFKGKAIKEGGKVTGIFGIARDITERKKMEIALRRAKEKAESATRLKDQFVSLVSHDLRSPISSVLGFFRHLRTDAKKTEGFDLIEKEMLVRAERTCSYLIDTIDQLLDVGRLRTGSVELRKVTFSLSPLIQEIIESVINLADAKKVTLHNEVDGKVTLTADRELIGRVVANLLSNAIKFTPPDGDVRLFVDQEEPLRVAVKDNGAGVEKRMIPDLFRPEIKTSSLGTEGERGAGFGLPLSSDIMALHMGSLSCESEPGEGATFYINFDTGIRPPD